MLRTPSATPVPPAPLEGLRVLLVEDNPVNQRLSQALLEAAGAQCLLTDTGAGAVARVSQGGVEAVLMDLQLPDMDGLAATRLLRSRPGPQPVIVAATATSLTEQGAAAYAAGMDAFLEKPFGFDRLVDTLAGLTGRPASPAALRQFGGDAQAWRAALLAFARLYAAGLPSLNAACEGDLAAARRLQAELHGLAGACAALGAKDMQSRASLCEAWLQTPQQAAGAARASLLALQGALKRHAARSAAPR